MIYFSFLNMPVIDQLLNFPDTHDYWAIVWKFERSCPIICSFKSLMGTTLLFYNLIKFQGCFFTIDTQIKEYIKATENMVHMAYIFLLIIRERFIIFNNKRDYSFMDMWKYIQKSWIQDSAICHHPHKGKQTFFLIFQYSFQELQARPCLACVKVCVGLLRVHIFRT